MIFLAFVPDLVQGQADCSVKLKQCEKYYNDGNIDIIPSILDSCMKFGFSKKEKIQALKLKILIALYQDNFPEADENMLKLLTIEPEYEINKAIEEPEFVDLFENFQTSPVYSFGFIGGANRAQMQSTEKYGVYNTNNGYSDQYLPAYSYHFGIKGNMYLTSKMELNSELIFGQQKFSKKESFFGFSQVLYKETQTFISLPISVRYDLTKTKIKPFLRVGVCPNLLLNSTSTLIRSYTDNSHADIKGTEIDLSPYRNKFDISVFGGIGVKYKIKRGNISIDIRYHQFLMNPVKDSERYANSENIFKYYYLDDNFLLSRVELSLAYVYLIYKPEKK